MEQIQGESLVYEFEVQASQHAPGQARPLLTSPLASDSPGGCAPSANASKPNSSAPTTRLHACKGPVTEG